LKTFLSRHTQVDATLFTHLVFSYNEMFSLIRKINVDHMGEAAQINVCELRKDKYYINTMMAMPKPSYIFMKPEYL